MSKIVVFTGAPGCGKGTQARLLNEKCNIPHLSTGEMLRDAGKARTKLGLEAKALIDHGNLVPDEMVIKLISERIGQEDCKNGFILDGFPRTLPQAEVLTTMFEEKSLILDAVIEIQVPDEIIAERILGRYACAKCGAGYHDKFISPKVYGVCDYCGDTEFVRRIDDNRATVATRLTKYRALTVPILPYFEEKGKLFCIDGTGSIDAVQKKVNSVLGL